MTPGRIALALVLAALSSGIEPPRKAPVKFPRQLLAGPISDVPMHSGYVNVTEKDYLFYWFFEADVSAPIDAPVIVWSNGGPGCSAMEGATTEIGPLVMYNAKTGGFDGKLTHNAYAWNQKAHMLVVDQPRYTGFSTGTGDLALTSHQAGLDMVQFLLGWRRLFPAQGSSSFILASESYGGRFVPAWANAIFEHNTLAASSDRLTVSGMAIGNGCIDQGIQNDAAFIAWAKEQKLLGHNQYPANEAQARIMIQHRIGYTPNIYDYRLVDAGACCACMGYDYSAWAHWLLKPEIKEALNVCGNAGDNSFAGCHGGCLAGLQQEFDRDQGLNVNPVETLNRALEEDIPVTLFYGMQDTSCNYVGGYAVASALHWSGKDHWERQGMQPLLLGGASAGSIKSAGGLTWIQIEGAGHMAAVDNGGAAAFVIDHLLGEIDRRARPKSVLMQKDEVLPKQAHLESRAHHLHLNELALALTASLSVVALLLFAVKRRACSALLGATPEMPRLSLDDEEPLFR